MPSPTQKRSTQIEPSRARPENQPEEDILRSNTTCYKILDFKGEGSFGKVAMCFDLNTSEIVAVKIHKDNKDDLVEREVAMLEAVGVLDPDKKNIVRFIDNFRYHDHSCLAFEMLDMSLWDLMKKRQWKPLSLNEIRPVTHQLLVAFEALKSIGIMHTDLKPDNVMLVNQKDQPFKIKLIDFGLAMHTSEVEVGMMMQANSYRAPEVNLGLPLSESVDMWGVGCVMAFLYFGGNLFPCNCPYHWMKTMVHLVGQPDSHHIFAGLSSWAYFIWDDSTGLRLRTPEEFEQVTGEKPEVYKRPFDSARNLKDAVMNYTPTEDHLEYEDRRTFVDLLRSSLYPDYELRITPREAVKHSFITMDHLKMATSSYTDTALQLMTVSPLDTSDESDANKDYEDYSNAAFISDLQKNPYWHHGKDSSTYSGYDADAKEFSAETEHRQSESDTVSNNCCRFRNTYSYKCHPCGYDADIDSFGDEPVPKVSKYKHRVRKHLLRRKQRVKRYCDHLNNNANTKTSWEPASSHSYHQDQGFSNPTNGVSIKSTKSPGPSAETSCHDGARDTVTPSKPEPDSSAPHDDDHPNTHSMPLAIDDDSPSADFAPTNGATAASQTVDTDAIKKAPHRHNAFQRLNKFFRRVEKRLSSIFKPGKKQSNSSTQHPAHLPTAPPPT